MTGSRQLLEESFRHALGACDPGRLVRALLPAERPALVLAVGKAASSMVAQARRAYPGVAWLATPPGAVERTAAATGSVERPAAATGSVERPAPAPQAPPLEANVIAGSHPLPGPGSVAAASRALELAAGLNEGDLLLVLISGGGSALWCAPWGASLADPGSAAPANAHGVDLEAKRGLTLALQRAGADIHELNTVRRHLSRIKGGRLAEATRARVHTLALSDVPGDDLSDIASGPTVPDATTFADALAVVRRHGVGAPAVTRHLESGAAGALPETPKPGSRASSRWTAEVIGSAAALLGAAEAYWTRRGHGVVVLSDALQGEARELARGHAELVSALCRGDDPRRALLRLGLEDKRIRAVERRLAAWRPATLALHPLVLLSGGEATVTVTGSGRGGRNLEFAAWLLRHLEELGVAGDAAHARGSGATGGEGLGVWALSAGSDGVDGSSEAAGAFLTPDSTTRADALGLKLDAFLAANDTDTFFARLGDRLVTGPTGNNLNDYRAVVLRGAAR